MSDLIFSVALCPYEWDAIAIDGKIARDSADGDIPGVHLLAGVEAVCEAAAIRRLAAHPEEAVPLLFT